MIEEWIKKNLLNQSDEEYEEGRIFAMRFTVVLGVIICIADLVWQFVSL
jgi:hypothetical protein